MSVSYALNAVLQWHGMWAEAGTGVCSGVVDSHRHCHPAVSAKYLQLQNTAESSRGVAVSRAVLTAEHLAMVLSLVKDRITVNFSRFTLVCLSRPFATRTAATQCSIPEFWSQLSLRQC